MFLLSCSNLKKNEAEYDKSIQIAVNYLDRMEALELDADAQSYYIDGVVLQQKGKFDHPIHPYQQIRKIHIGPSRFSRLEKI